jgi:hypothetical protein
MMALRPLKEYAQIVALYASSVIECPAMKS